MIHDGTLLIEDDYIVAVGLPNDAKIPNGARTVDCTGNFILPGYIDTHVDYYQIVSNCMWATFFPAALS